MTRGCCATCPRTGEALARTRRRCRRRRPVPPRWRGSGGVGAPEGVDRPDWSARQRSARRRRRSPARPRPPGSRCPPRPSSVPRRASAARPVRAGLPRGCGAPGAGSACRCAVIHCSRGVRGSRVGDVTWARISPGGLARIERRWISSLRARIVRAEADRVALTWHYASRARSALVPTRAGPVRAGPDPRQPAPRGGRLIRTRRETARPALVPARESAGSRFGVGADPDPVPVPFRLGRVHEIVG